MNDKITFPRLSSLLADKSGRSKRFSEDFLREFFALISETLATGESVKVKGLGTFRLSRVEPRKSVDVTTGQPMEISGHSKVVFIPAKEMADAVNAPFEAFTAIEIDDEADLSQIFPKDEIDLQGQTEREIEETDAEDANFGVIEENTPVAIPEEESGAYGANPVFAATSETSEPAEASQESEESDISEKSEESEISEIPEESEISEISGESEEPEEPENSDATADNEASVEDEDPYEEDEEDLDPSTFRKRNWKRTLLISLGAAVIALVATFAVWYVFATNDFNRIFNPRATSQVQESALAAEADIAATTEDSTLSDSTAAEEASLSPTPIAEESEVPTAPSDAVVYDTISTTRYLTTMAKAHYGNFNLWPYIYEENKAILGHPDRIRPGTPVVIPKLSKYGVDASNKDDVEKAKKMGVEIYARFGKKI